MQFKYFLGNERIKEQISYLLASDRLPHAIILEGDSGLGKHVLAREIAAALVCRSEDAPCYLCAQCRKAQQQIHPDIYEYTPEGGSRSFHKDVIKTIIDDVCMAPNEADYKVYILANAHLMSASAQNAILKVLEEPPSYVRFILTVDTKSVLLPTVLSRSVVFTLEGVPVSVGAQYIAAQQEDVDTERAEQAVAIWNGNIGKAIESLKDGKAAQLASVCVDVCHALVSENEYALMKVCAVFQKDRQSILNACMMLRHLFRDALLYDMGADVLSGNAQTAELLSSKCTRKALLALIQTTEEIYAQADANANNALIVTKFCYALRQAAGR